ncbi:MAG TPA: anthranilate synthase component I, partial [Actinomycetota bacterium]|nr:anthranilate synthase component I [Actinomycetota bacterium]
MTVAPRCRPSREAFDDLAREWPLVPVWAELLADVSTPVGLFPALAGDGPGILLESVERSERWGRYSFVAGDPAATLVADRDGLHLRDVVRDLPLPEPGASDPREALIAAARAMRGPRLPDLPPLTGGLMGYLAYEAATLLDGHPAPRPADAPCPPIGLLAIDRAVVFDHWRQRLLLVAHVPAGRYGEGVAAVEDLATRIATAPLPPL